MGFKPRRTPPEKELLFLARAGSVDALMALADDGYGDAVAYKWLWVAESFGHRAAEHIDTLLEVYSLRYDDDCMVTGSAHFEIGCAFLSGSGGFPVDHAKAAEHFHLAGERLYAENFSSEVKRVASTLKGDELVLFEKALLGPGKKRRAERNAIEEVQRALNRLDTHSLREALARIKPRSEVEEEVTSILKTLDLDDERTCALVLSVADHLRSIVSLQYWLGEVCARDYFAATDPEVRARRKATLESLAPHILAPVVADEFLHRKKWQEAVDCFDLAIRSPGLPPTMYSHALYACCMSSVNGVPTSRHQCGRFLKRCVPHGPKLPSIFENAASLFVVLGDRHAMLCCLRAAVHFGYRRAAEIVDDPIYEAYRSDPEFLEIFANIDSEEFRRRWMYSDPEREKAGVPDELRVVLDDFEHVAR